MTNKQGTCVDCLPEKGVQHIYSSGRCRFHYWDNRRKENLKKKKVQFAVAKKDGFIPTLQREGNVIAYPSPTHLCNFGISDTLHFASPNQNIENAEVHFASAKSSANYQNIENAEQKEVHFASAKSTEKPWEDFETAKRRAEYRFEAVWGVHFASAKSSANFQYNNGTNEDKLVQIAKHLLKTGYTKGEVDQLIRSFEDAERRKVTSFTSARRIFFFFQTLICSSALRGILLRQSQFIRQLVLGD